VRVTNDFADGVAIAREAGFDAVEIHLGHNYLLSAFLSPKLNRRRDAYGGSLENRARFPRRVLRAVRDAAGDRLAVTAKLNMSDGVRGGLEPDESLAVARMLEADGVLDAIELTGGSSLSNPMYLFRGDAPVTEFAATLPQPIRMGFMLFGRRFLKEYPFEEAYFRADARRFRDALKMPVILLGGINKLATIRSALDEGFAFVAMARALLREPDLVNRMRAGAASEATCIHCNKCMPTIYRGTHCALDAVSP
jgi:2,4-dienoyl-CoA reductase-like NADH-dependent reductase (Old Yellow Enzyme family)